MKVQKAKKSQLCCFRNCFRCVRARFLLHWHKILVKPDWITKFEKNPSAASADRPLQRNPVFWAFWGPQTYPRASGAQFLHSPHLRHQANPISHKKNHAQIFFCASQIPASQAVWVKAILLLSKTHLMKFKVYYPWIQYPDQASMWFPQIPSSLQPSCELHLASCLHLGGHADISCIW